MSHGVATAIMEQYANGDGRISAIEPAKAAVGRTYERRKKCGKIGIK